MQTEDVAVGDKDGLGAEPWRGLRLPDPDPARLGFWWLADQAESVLSDYWQRFHESAPAEIGRRRIRAAALALSNALDGPGGNPFFLLGDRVTRDAPAGPVVLDPVDYLHALAEDFREPEPAPAAKHSRALRPFVLRAMRERVRHVFPDRERTRWGFNVLAAALCSEILAVAVQPADVANAVRGTDLARGYWKD